MESNYWKNCQKWAHNCWRGTSESHISHGSINDYKCRKVYEANFCNPRNSYRILLYGKISLIWTKDLYRQVGYTEKKLAEMFSSGTGTQPLLAIIKYLLCSLFYSLRLGPILRYVMLSSPTIFSIYESRKYTGIQLCPRIPRLPILQD
jgi:hypothetical protein